VLQFVAVSVTLYLDSSSILGTVCLAECFRVLQCVAACVVSLHRFLEHLGNLPHGRLVTLVYLQVREREREREREGGGGEEGEGEREEERAREREEGREERRERERDRERERRRRRESERERE